MRNGRRITIENFDQGRLSNPEVDAFRYRISDSGMKYRLYTPTVASAPEDGAAALIVWLHGGGEGASLPDDYYDNETRCAPTAGRWDSPPPRPQQIFNGAYVVAPQSTSYWIEDGVDSPR